ncbi:murein hydrolase activator EnvC family protein [uncultured Flavonifractor sp.]|uniref:murein hydrolase activator EnvC family protein n=1 Tax=uncultured Flavonifractor sp. TaxID=1193534 RepID=UPI00261165E5|nr:peptidoglycan DD-metalloendopeptidase family protein [uncultured Flavonifractor sp.]
MRRKIRTIPLVCVVLVLAMAATLFLQAGAVTQSEIDALKKQQQASQAKQQELKEQLAEVKEDQAAAQQKRQILVQQLDAINGEIDNINAQIAWYDGEISKKEEERRQAEAREAEQYELFCERVRAMEEEGSVSYWSILFNANSFSDLMDRIADVDAVMDYDNAVMDQLIATRQELERLQAELESARSEEQAAKEQQEAKKAEQQAKVAEAQQLLDQINANLDEVNRQLDAEDAAAADIQAQIAKKQKQLEEERKQQNITLPPTGSGYQWPLPAGNLKLTSAFGYRMHPIDLVPHSHTGIDVAAAGGTPIYAAKGGQVIMSVYGSGVNWSYGNFVVIDHGDGTTTLYAHMSRRAVSEGQLVSQGQTIGYVGNTGNSKGNHLHFEVRVNGQRVDPEGCFPGLSNSFIRAYNW